KLNPCSIYIILVTTFYTFTSILYSLNSQILLNLVSHPVRLVLLISRLDLLIPLQLSFLLQILDFTSITIKDRTISLLRISTIQRLLDLIIKFLLNCINTNLTYFL